MADMSSLEDAVRERGRQLRDSAMAAVERGLRDEAGKHRVTGRMADEVTVEPFETGDTVGCRADSPTEYSQFVDSGTGPHEIRPRSAKALRFEVAGVVVFAKVVQHPGYQPTVRWFTDTVADWPRYLVEAQ